MKKICLQAGHVNTENNSIVALRKSTGAPGERDFTADIVNRVAEIFKNIPEIEITVTDAIANDRPEITSKDWDLFLSVHYDADIYNDSGGFIDYPEPSTDHATEESQRIASEIAKVYFAKSGVKQVQKRSNANTRFFYMWKYLSAKTPCNILEFGVGWRKPNDYELLNTEDGRNKTAHIFAEALCSAFGVEYPFTDGEGGNFDDIDSIKQKAGYYTTVQEMIGVTKDRFSLVTARINELLQAYKDYSNKVEQVERLKGQISLLNQQIETLSSDKDAVIKGLNTNIKQLHAANDQLGKDKGALNLYILELEEELKQCKTMTDTPVASPADNFIKQVINFLQSLVRKDGDTSDNL